MYILKFAFPILLLIATGCSRVEEPESIKTQPLAEIEVWKTPTCGCCTAWVDHLKAEGFSVKVNDVDSTAEFRRQVGVPQEYGSCHTGLVEGYALEGHVPASDIRTLLKDRPDVVGLAVPGMPVGSPGMEDPRRPSKRHQYDVLAIEKDGSVFSFTHYPAQN